MRSYACSAFALVVTLFSGLSVLGVATPALAQPPSVAVLGVEPVQLPDMVAQQVTDALRRSIKNGTGHRQVQGKDLVELKMVFGCDGETPACLAQAGKSLQADKLIFGRVKRVPNRTGIVRIELQLLDVEKAKVLTSVNDTLPRGEIGGHVDGWLAKLFSGDAAAPVIAVVPPPPVAATIVSIVTTPTGATITLDGKPLGETPLELTTIPAGTHNAAITLDGYEAVNRTWTVAAGQRQVFQLQLAPLHPVVAVKPELPTPLEAPPPRTPTSAELRTSRIVTGVGAATLVVGGVLGAVSIWSWYRYTSIESDLSNRVPLFVPTGAASSTEAQWLQHPNCSPPSSLAQFGNIQAFAKDCKQGQSYAHATTGLLTSATILGVGGLVMIVVGAQLDARVRRGDRKPSAFHLVPTPMVAAGTLGLQAAGTF